MPLANTCDVSASGRGRRWERNDDALASRDIWHQGFVGYGLFAGVEGTNAHAVPVAPRHFHARHLGSVAVRAERLGDLLGFFLLRERRNLDVELAVRSGEHVGSAAVTEF